MGKIIFLDIDGTIRDFDGTILKSSVEAIKKARKNGHEVVLNTGRLYYRIEKRIMNIGFDGVIAGSGGYVEYRGERLVHKYFTQLAYIELMKDLLEQACIVEMGNSRESYVLRENWEEYCRIFEEMRREMHIRKADAIMPLPMESLLDVPEVEKLLVFSSEEASRMILYKWGYSFHIINLRLPFTERWTGQITPKYTTKAEGVRQILKAGRYRREDAVAVGDSDSDIETLRYVGTGIAMGNGTEWLKEIADHVTASVREDGLWKAFSHLGLL